MTARVQYVYSSNKNYVPKWVIAFTYHWWRFLLRPFGVDTANTWNNQICKKFWALFGIFLGPWLTLQSVSMFAGHYTISKLGWIFAVMTPSMLLIVWGLRVFVNKYFSRVLNALERAFDATEAFVVKKVVWIPVALAALVLVIKLIVFVGVNYWEFIAFYTGLGVWLTGLAVLVILGVREALYAIDRWYDQPEKRRARETKKVLRQKERVAYVREAKARKAQRRARNRKRNPVFKFFVGVAGFVVTLVLSVLDLVSFFLIDILWKKVLFPVLKGLGVMVRSAYQKSCPIVTVKRVVIEGKK